MNILQMYTNTPAAGRDYTTSRYYILFWDRDVLFTSWYYVLHYINNAHSDWRVFLNVANNCEFWKMIVLLCVHASSVGTVEQSTRVHCGVWALAEIWSFFLTILSCFFLNQAQKTSNETCSPKEIRDNFLLDTRHSWVILLPHSLLLYVLTL